MRISYDMATDRCVRCFSLAYVHMLTCPIYILRPYFFDIMDPRRPCGAAKEIYGTTGVMGQRAYHIGGKRYTNKR